MQTVVCVKLSGHRVCLWVLNVATWNVCLRTAVPDCAASKQFCPGKRKHKIEEKRLRLSFLSYDTASCCKWSPKLR
jgi:hypothetical protein